MCRFIRFTILLVVVLLTIGCVRVVEENIETEPYPHAPQAGLTNTPETKTPTVTPVLLKPSPTAGLKLPGTDQVIFTIVNAEPWSGREGDLRPDWKGWGAETFAAAPDGTFWIADTAISPNRLLQFSPQGEPLKEVPLKDKVIFVYDMLVTTQEIWLLDISAEQPRIVKLGLDGEMLAGGAKRTGVDIPKKIMSDDDMYVNNGAFGLLKGEEGELLLATVNGYYELDDASREVIAQPLDALPYYGHTYLQGTYNRITGKLPVYLDGVLLDVSEDMTMETPFLGFNPDGSFPLAGYEQAADEQADYLVRYISAEGEVLGTARQFPQNFYKDFNHHLAFGPDGVVYQLLSNPDHSVQVIRLGFSQTLPSKPEALEDMPVSLTPLMPAGTATTEAEQARNTLVEFFDHLSSGNYAEAAVRFGGEVEDYMRDPLPDESPDAYWEHLCQFLWCLPVVEITQEEQISEGEYIFYTVFMQPDGTRFEIGACCGGDPAATPPVWQFAYPVQKIGEEWKVMRAPLFTP